MLQTTRDGFLENLFQLNMKNIPMIESVSHIYKNVWILNRQGVWSGAFSRSTKSSPAANSPKTTIIGSLETRRTNASILVPENFAAIYF